MQDNLTSKQLAALDELNTVVGAGSSVVVDTIFGEVGVRKAGVHGFIADLDPDAEFPEYSAKGETPAAALLKLRDTLAMQADVVVRRKVIAFPAARKCRLCYKPLRHGVSDVHMECSRTAFAGLRMLENLIEAHDDFDRAA